ncbi:MAG: hypothetical protein A3I05_07625 [Deltaproteobacteria bacterium RIFCSPLOWO2_02_FULL_44_10]|nr:MAG: hypothetical protein A3C46_04375 [Deltaproteobacteria bacterium RIFCSPHIGHO2_02_FULL_44_16]OGQ47042.1 MAG: hypothetical protein A3I05_07625 [Deltaproteobacteria bacterium RIFCSPLOWO2_02_FULL_44_10]
MSSQKTRKNRPHYVLLLEENDHHAELLTELLDQYAAPVVIHAVDNLSDAMTMLQTNAYDLIFASAKIGDVPIEQFLDELFEKSHKAPVLVMAGSGNERKAAELTKKGVSEYLVKTKENLELLPDLIARYLKRRRKLPEVRTVSSENKAEEILREVDRIALHLTKLKKKKKDVFPDRLLDQVAHLKALLLKHI